MVLVDSVGAWVAAVDAGEVSVEEDSSFFGYSWVRKDSIKPGIRSLRKDEEYIRRGSCTIRVLLTFFLSRLEVPLPLRDGVLGPLKRSKKLILTGWPFALRRGAISTDI